MNHRFLTHLQSEKLTLIMSLPENNPALAEAAWENGADAVKVHINVEHRASKTLFQGFTQERERLMELLQTAKGPTGIVLGGDPVSAAKECEAVAEAGFEFISLYAHHTPMEVLDSKRLLKMLAIDYTYSLDEVRNLHKAGAEILEASIVKPETYGEPLTARELLSYRTIAEHADMPVVIPTQRRMRPSDVEHLAACGVHGIMLGAIVTGKTRDSIAKAVASFRNYIDRM